MRLFQIMALSSAAISLGRAGIPVADTIVCLEGWGIARAGVLPLAKRQAASILSTAGIRIDWCEASSTGCPAQQGAIVIRVRFEGRTPEEYRTGALAEAFPYMPAGGAIKILYDRVASIAPRSHDKQAIILGHILAHEVTHVLQMSDGHSETGVMKAHWNADDYMAMLWKPLEFESGQAARIQQGLAARLGAAAR